MRRILGIGIVLLTVVGGGVAVFTTTARFRELARDQLNSLLEGSFRGKLEIGGLEGSVWGDLSLVDLTLRYQDRILLRVPRVHLVYSFLPLLGGTLRIDRMSIVRPEILAHQDGQGRWDLLEAFSTNDTREDSGGGLGAPLEVAFDSIEVTRGSIRATTVDSRRYEGESVEARAHASFGSSGIRATIRRLAFALRLPDRPRVLADAALVYQGTSQPPILTIERLVATTDRSRAELAGTLRWLAAPSVDAHLRLEPVVASDIHAFVPQVSTATDLRGTLSVKGSLDDFAAALDLEAAEGRVTADLHGDLAHEPPRFRGTGKATNVHLARLLGDARFDGVVDAKLEANGSPIALRSIRAKADVSIDRFVVHDWRVEKLSASAELSDGRGVVAASLNDPVGAADLHGTIGLDEIPSYDLRLEVSRLNPAPAFPGSGAVPGSVNLTATVTGRGLSLAEMRNDIRLTVRPSKIDQVEIHRGELRARIADRRLTLDQLTLRAETAQANASGVVGLAPGAPVEVSYSAAVSRLDPWLALAGRSGQGRLSVEGRAAGRRGNLATRGRVELHAASFAPVAVGDADVHYDVAGIGGTLVHGGVTASLTDLRAHLYVQSLRLTATLPDHEPQALHLEATTQRDGGASDHVEATVTRMGTKTGIALTALELALPDGTWRLPSPAHVTVEGESAIIDGLGLVNGFRMLKIDGRLARSGTQDLRLDLAGFPLQDLAPLLSLEDLGGSLSAEAKIGGTAAAPTLEVSAQAKELQVAGGRYQGLSAEARYTDGSARLALELQQDALHRLEALGTLPMNVGWESEWTMAPTGPVDLEAHSSGIDLAFLNAFGGKAIRDAGGRLMLDLTVKGPLSQPVPRGTIALRDGQLRIVSLGVHIEQIEGTVSLDGDMLRLKEFSAKSGGGSLHASAAAPLRPDPARALSGEVSFEKWPAIHTRRYQANIGGTLTAGGRLSALRVEGRLDVLDANLRPRLDFLKKGPPTRDDTIVFVGGPPPLPSQEQGNATNGVPNVSGASVYRALSMDVTVGINRNTWIKHEAATVELRGSLHLAKAPLEQLVVDGRIETLRGWVNFQGKRFTITQGRIVFTGGRKINPNLDVVASYKTGGYDVQVVIGGSVNSPSMTLRSNPTLEQADILSVLLFGKPANDLSGDERTSLANHAAGIVGSYAATQVGESVMRSLGIQNLGVQVEEVSAERVAIGKYIGENTYVTLGQTIGTKPGQEVSLEYEFTPRWRFVLTSSTNGTDGVDLRWDRHY